MINCFPMSVFTFIRNGGCYVFGSVCLKFFLLHYQEGNFWQQSVLFCRFWMVGHLCQFESFFLTFSPEFFWSIAFILSVFYYILHSVS